jgi:tight adherence protein B
MVFVATRPSPAERNFRTRLSSITKQSAHESSLGIRLSDKEGSTWIDRVSEIIERHRVGMSLDRLIVHAGSEGTSGQIVMIGLAIGAPAGLIAQELRGFLPLSIGAAVLGLLSPVLYLMWKKGSRLRKFDDALPDAIELMARALRAGHSVGSAVEMISQQSTEPLASEFANCFQQQKFGIPFRDTLLAMGERIPSPDLQFFITAVLVQKETGGDLIDILERTTRLIRDRIRIKGEIKSYTAQGRLTGWILSSLPLVLLFVMNLISPGYSDSLFTEPLGKLLLVAGGVMILIGSWIISKIVDIKV